MRRVVLLIAGALLLAVFAAALLLRTVVDPDAIRPVAETRLSSMLGQPVSIGSMRVSIFPSPAVMGSDIRVGAAATPELTLRQIRIVPRLGSLFRGPYVIREVTLDGLTARVVREPPGRWRFPAVIPAPSVDSGQQVVIERVRLTGGRVPVFQATPGAEMREMSSIDGLEGEAVAEAAGLRISAIRGRVGGAAISGEALLDARSARIDFSMPAIENADLPNVLALTGAAPPESVSLTRPASASISIRIDRNTLRLSGTGSLRAPEISAESIRLRNVEAPIKTDGASISLDPTTFSLYGGTYRGRVTIDLTKTPARWLLDGRAADVDVGEFLRDVTGQDRVAGRAAATTALRGIVGEPVPQALTGRAVLEVTNGVIRRFPLLSAINRALQLAEGDADDTRFERLSGTFVFGAGSGTTDDLVLTAGDLSVRAHGRLGFDRSLDLTGIAAVSPERAARAIGRIPELARLKSRGNLELPLRITGTLDNPSFNIDLRAVIGRSLEDELKRRLRGLIRR